MKGTQLLTKSHVELEDNPSLVISVSTSTAISSVAINKNRHQKFHQHPYNSLVNNFDTYFEILSTTQATILQHF